MLTQADLNQFIGGDQYYKHWSGLLFTDGVKFLAEEAKAYWLIDAIASYQREPKVLGNSRLQEFQLWHLTVANNEAVLQLRDDSTSPVVISQDIEYTDFPLTSLKLYVEGGVLLLPSEH